jgi:outer membrane protein assembly factor BamB
MRLYREVTVDLARISLEADDAERCSTLLAELDPVDYGDLSVRLLRAKALTRLKDRIALIAEVEAIAKDLSGGAKRKHEKESAAFCRDAIAVLAPERTDLLKRLHELCEGKRSRNKRVVLVAALLAVVGTGGFLLWPTGPAALLEKARTATAEGDREEAAALIARLVEEYPDSPETQEALRLQSLAEADRKRAVIAPVAPNVRKRAEESIPEWIAAIRALPAEPARRTLQAMLELLVGPDGAGLRPPVLLKAHAPLTQAVQTLARNLRLRTDVLASLKMQAQNQRPKAEVVRALLQEASGFVSDGYVDDAAAARDLLQAIDESDPADAYVLNLREVDQALKQLRSALKSAGPDFDGCRRIVAAFDLEDDYEVCREDAPKMLVAGRLDEADECYVRLEKRLEQFQQDPVLQPLHEEAVKRQIPQFLRDRRSQIAEIHRGIEAAKAAERADDFAAAGRIYADLAKRYWFVRFENVFAVPLRVETVPAGARVSVDGREVGTSPLTVRYTWASQTSVTVDAPGFQPATEVLDTTDAAPVAKIVVRLTLKPHWTSSVSPTVSVRPTVVGEDVLVVDRAGRVTLHASLTGDVAWARQLGGLEGVRSRPGVTPTLIAVARVDGRLAFLSTQDGTVLEEVEVGRPVGDVATSGDLIAVAVQPRQLVVFQGRKPHREVALAADPTAGVVAAHGAFWVGNADGDVERVEIATGTRRTVELERARAHVIGIAATRAGVLVTTADGSLYALDASGSPKWRTSDLGDVVGTPAAAGSTVACVDRQGRVLLFDALSGAPKGQQDMRGEPLGGLLGVEERFVGATAGGNVWIFDARTMKVLVDAPAGPDASKLPPGDLGGGRLALPAREKQFQVVRLVDPAPTNETDR